MEINCCSITYHFALPCRARSGGRANAGAKFCFASGDLNSQHDWSDSIGVRLFRLQCSMHRRESDHVGNTWNSLTVASILMR